MTEHVEPTPGPWSVKSDEGTTVRDGNGDRLCGMSYLKGNIGRRDAMEVTANARLMAAAPDLLEACEHAEAALNGLSDALKESLGITIGPTARAVQGQLKAAILKAKVE